MGFYCGKINSVLRETNVLILSHQINNCIIQERIGNLTHNKDHWYELSYKGSFELVTSQVTIDIESFLIPHFEKYNSLDKLKELVLKNDIDRTYLISPLSHFVFLMITNQIETAAKKIKTEYENALEPQSNTHTINYPDGTSKVYTSHPFVNQTFIDNLEKFAKFYNIELKK